MEKADHVKICFLNPNHRKENVLVKRISDPQLCHEALELAVKLFMEFEAPDYSTEGINEFKRSLESPEYIGNLIEISSFNS